MSKFTHFDEDGRTKMVDVSDKKDTVRIAIAKGSVKVKEETLKAILDKEINKGDVLEVARIAGIMGAKKTSDLIPMCHPLLISKVKIEFAISEYDNVISIYATTKTTGKTGIEIESLTAVSIAGLTIYDMCKAMDRSIEIGEIKLLKKSGGKSGVFLSDDLKGNISNVFFGTERGVPKIENDFIELREDYGVVGDIHAIEGRHQVSILSKNSVDKFKANDLTLGTFEANIIIENIDLYKFPIKTRVKFGTDAIVEITQIGKKDVLMEDHYNTMYHEGIFVKVISSGIIKKDDKIEVILND